MTSTEVGREGVAIIWDVIISVIISWVPSKPRP